MEIKGKNGVAKVFTELIDEGAQEQVQKMMDEPITENAQVRIMPDVHVGKGSTVGTTIMFESVPDLKISPNVVGVDIGCGITALRLNTAAEIDVEKLDKIIQSKVPSGFNVHNRPSKHDYLIELFGNLTMPLEEKDKKYFARSLRSLGGGNHYIELAKDEEEHYWLSVHSGSRNLGVRVASYHQDKAENRFKELDVNAEVERLKAEGRTEDIQLEIAHLKKEAENKPEIKYLQGTDLRNYLKDMKLTQEYARINREEMLKNILAKLKIDWHTAADIAIDSPHNFVEMNEDRKEVIIRKGATPAYEGQYVIIPINMKDGTLICRGKGSREWNYSAPHGAGRQLSRSQARKRLNLQEYVKSMDGIYSTSLSKKTLDEAPLAYKPMENLLENIKDTVEVEHHLKPVYNFKAQ